MTEPTHPAPSDPTRHREQAAEEPSNEQLRRLTRRGLLGLSAGLLVACSDPTSTVGGPSSVAPSPGAGSAESSGAGSAVASASPDVPGCVLMPQETSGPFPIDLTADPTFVRSDISEGRPGVPLTMTLTLVDVAAGCAPLPGVRVDVWHTDAAGDYSGFESQPSGSTVGQTFCRGIQTSDAAGSVTFRSIYPGWYPGRVAHVHFEAYLDDGRLVAGSQMAFPDEVTAAVHTSAEAYAARGANPTVASVADDFLFADGAAAQTAAVSGDPATGLQADLRVGIAL